MTNFIGYMTKYIGHYTKDCVLLAPQQSCEYSAKLSAGRPLSAQSSIFCPFLSSNSQYVIAPPQCSGVARVVFPPVLTSRAREAISPFIEETASYLAVTYSY